MGRPVGSKNQRIGADALRKVALEYVKGKSGPKKIEAAARKMVAAAMAGDTTVFREFGDRIDGKVPQAMVGEDNGPIKVEIIHFEAPK